ncbi:enoyl-CoA hydratase/isomerase family protein [Tsukamurella hominis]|uniref:enoyl-CoA hydratase/isomerase family protein n=1 Tax=Tsukamurella hominis TaxID=1970232 RepID=UPI0039E7DD61
MPETAAPGPVEVTRAGAVATVLLARRAFDGRTAVALRDALRSLGADQRVRCVVLTGQGTVFNYGADVRSIDLADPAAGVRAIVGPLHDAVFAIATMPQPVVAAVNGTAAGGGMGLALHCDVVLATESASFVPAFAAIGVPPDTGFSIAVPRLIGTAAAFRLYTEDTRLSAVEAFDAGLVRSVHPDDRFAAAATAHAEQLASGPGAAFAAAKRLFRGAPEALRSQLDAEAAAVLECVETEEFRLRVARVAAH